MKIKFALFDLDGTLTDPALGITNSVMYALKKFGIEVCERRSLYKFIGPPLIDSFMEFYGFSKEDAERALAYYREYFASKGLYENVLYEGIDRLLSQLKENGIKVVLATSKPEEYAKEILKHFGILKYFDYISGATMDEKRNTKDAVIDYAINNIKNFNLQTAVMVGDRRFDIEGGKQFGMKTVAVTYGYGTNEELIGAKPDYIAKTVEELTEFFQSRI